MSVAAQPRAATVLHAEHVAKSFGPTRALRDGTLELLAGEVHVLVGENGSGKSTLVKILSGVHEPDAGTLALGGEQLSAIGSPRRAQEHGIVTVFQEVLVAEARSVLDNVWLGVDTLIRHKLSASEKRTRAQRVLAELLDRPPDLDTPVEELSLSDRQACCLARALLRDARVLILDEATSALDVETRDRLFAIVQRLTGDGVGVIFITHRMDEVAQLGDRITVMRSGTTVATLERGAWTVPELVRLMTGAEQLTGEARSQERRPRTRGDVVLSARALTLAPGTAPFDVDFHAGELVGVAGLEGHGQEAFLHALRGAGAAGGTVVRSGDGSGKDGKDGKRERRIDSLDAASRSGIAYVPRERGHAVFAWMSVRANFGLPTLTQDSRGGWLSRGSTRRRLNSYVERLGIVLGNQDDRITTLSGGNQQKVVIARWLASNPRVLLLNDPTRGIDIGAKRDLYRLLADLAEEGLAVVMLSTEVDEHIELMDRVLVFREHALSREIGRDRLSRNTLVAAFFGETDDDDGIDDGAQPKGGDDAVL